MGYPIKAPFKWMCSQPQMLKFPLSIRCSVKTPACILALKKLMPPLLVNFKQQVELP